MTEDQQFDEECKEQFKNYYEVLEVVKEELGEFNYVDFSCEALGGHTPESWKGEFMFCSHCGKTLEER